MELRTIDELLELYSLEEILEQADVTVAEALEFMIEEGYVDLPIIKPVTIWEDTSIPPTDLSEELEN